MSLRDELIQVAAVVVAWVTDMEQGNTAIVDEHGQFTHAHRVVMADVGLERFRQEQKWGQRADVPIGEWLAILIEEIGEVGKAMVEEEFYPEVYLHGAD